MTAKDIIKLKIYKSIGNLRYGLSMLKKQTLIFAKLEDYYLPAYFNILGSSKNKNIDEYIYDLSVIIPVYNGEKWIKKCLLSVLDQMSKYKLEIIVVDDGSTDNTPTILRDMKRSYSNLSIIRQNNKGHAGARNTGIKFATGRFLMFVDADDLLFENAIDMMMQKIIDEDADVVIGKNISFTHEKQLSIESTKYRADYTKGVPWGKIYHNSFFKKIIFPENYLYEDTIISFLVLPLSKKTIYINKIVYGYRIHPESITQTHDKNIHRLDSFYLLEKMLYAQRELGIPSEKYYELYKKHVRNSFWRIIEMEKDIKYSAFQYVRRFFIEEFPDKIKADKTKFGLSISKNKYESFLILIYSGNS